MHVQRIGYGVFVTIEGWGCNLVGCYGNAMVPTPSLDAFAAKSWVFDQFWMDRFEPADLLRGMAPCDTDSQEWMIVTHTREAAEYFQQFGNVEVLELWGGDKYESAFLELILRSIELWEEKQKRYPYLWIHSRGLCSDWDSPYPARMMMCDEGDPDPPAGKDRPEIVLPEDYDPDERFKWTCVAGGQALCIDRGICELTQLLESAGIDDQCFVVLAGVQGYPLGEHKRIGFQGTGGYAERLHCPLLIHVMQDDPLGGRVEGFMQPSGLSQWMRSLVSRIAGKDGRVDFEGYTSNVAYAMGNGELAIITPAWSGRLEVVVPPEGHLELKTLGIFCHPEDRWQQNEIQDRVPEVQQLFQRIAMSILVREGVVESSGEGSEQETKIESLLEELAGYGR